MVCEWLIFRHCSCLLQGNNNFFVEKNPTIVTFPLKGTNLTDRCVGLTRASATPNDSRFGFAWLHPSGLSTCKPRDKICWDLKSPERWWEMLGLVVAVANNSWKDLVANVCHDGKPERGTYKVQAHILNLNTYHIYVTSVYCMQYTARRQILILIFYVSFVSLSLSDETLLFKRIRGTWELRFAGCEPVRRVVCFAGLPPANLAVVRNPWLAGLELTGKNTSSILPSYKRR